MRNTFTMLSACINKKYFVLCFLPWNGIPRLMKMELFCKILDKLFKLSRVCRRHCFILFLLEAYYNEEPLSLLKLDNV